VLAWSGKNIQELDRITKGGKIYVLGRLRNQKYTGLDGIERNTYDILASRLTLLDEGEPLQCEM
jgi:single-stranded DNA-binding protein